MEIIELQDDRNYVRAIAEGETFRFGKKHYRILDQLNPQSKLILSKFSGGNIIVYCFESNTVEIIAAHELVILTKLEILF